jgi:hypothetical protein
MGLPAEDATEVCETASAVRRTGVRMLLCGLGWSAGAGERAVPLRTAFTNDVVVVGFPAVGFAVGLFAFGTALAFRNKLHDSPFALAANNGDSA